MTVIRRYVIHIVVSALVILYSILVYIQGIHPNQDVWGYACLFVLIILIGILLPRAINFANKDKEKSES